jgi:hypothetical protein
MDQSSKVDKTTTGQLIEVNADCILKVVRFLMTQMSEPDLQQFRAHVSECCECQEYIDLISTMMVRRDQILKQLDLGGFR